MDGVGVEGKSKKRGRFPAVNGWDRGKLLSRWKKGKTMADNPTVVGKK